MIINIPFLDRGPKVETSIGIFIILAITIIMLSAAYSAYKNFTEIIAKNDANFENLDVKNQINDLDQ